MKKRVIIIGGGAAGSMAALTAAQNGADVLLLEQNEIIGRKILSTGNGRCNFTNRFQDPSCYRRIKMAICIPGPSKPRQ